MSLADVEAVARAVLYEGYILYPYRTSNVKNRRRWEPMRRVIRRQASTAGVVFVATGLMARAGCYLRDNIFDNLNYMIYGAPHGQ